MSLETGGPSLFELLKEDYETHDRELTQPGFWAIALHRVGAWAAARGSRVAVSVRSVHGALAQGSSSLLGIHLLPETKLGRRVRIWHHGCTRIAARSIGDDVHIRQNTIIGPADPGSTDPSTWPVIGNRVDIGSGACILGELEIGDQALVGANSFVTISAPPRSTVVGVPARLLPRMGKPRISLVQEEVLKGLEDQNPTDISFRALIAEDFRTHGSRFSAPGFWAVALHRFGNWRMGLRQKVLRAPFSFAYRLAFETLRQFSGIDLPYDIKLGRRVQIAHHGSIHVGARSIGSDVIIRHAASIGVVRAGLNDRKPIIEDRVEIGPRACVIGGVTIGHDSVIGANTVVPIDVQPGTVVLGVPARFVDLARITGGGAECSRAPPKAQVRRSRSSSD